MSVKTMTRALVLLIVVMAVVGVKGTELIERCEERWVEQPLDHFGWVAAAQPPSGPGSAPATFKQRYFVCSRETWEAERGPCFFYTGNEGDVELYLNKTGLMWESAGGFGAILVFAEHRFFGKSQPAWGTAGEEDKRRYLSSAQALEDYAVLIRELRGTLPLAPTAAVIAFGGSYGGMLATWMRLKHADAVDGAVAASAPVLGFLGLAPPYDTGGYAAIETADAGPECAAVVRRAWGRISTLAGSAAGRGELAQRLRLCSVPRDSAAALVAREWAADAIGYLAMGQFPYPSSYMTNGRCELPAWPLTVGCERAVAAAAASNDPLDGLRELVLPWFNCSGTAPCLSLDRGVNNETDTVGRLWDWLACTELVMPSSTDGVRDMFWDEPFDMAAYSDACFARNGVCPRPLEAATRYGGLKAIRASSNIVFTNGELDPWRAGGVPAGTPGLPPSIAAITVERGAHHLDLMFSDPRDPQSVKDARKLVLTHVATWIKQAALRVH